MADEARRLDGKWLGTGNQPRNRSDTQHGSQDSQEVPLCFIFDLLVRGILHRMLIL